MHARIILGLLLALGLATASLAVEPITLSFDQPETAGISGFRALWNTPVVLSEHGALDRSMNVTGGAAAYLEGPCAHWFPAGRQNGKQPGALVFDAVHRSLLVRFPGLAEAIAAQVSAGNRIAKVELLLPFRNTELWPEGYDLPDGMSFLRDEWVKTPPNWHAVAWGLRRPWTADPLHGPTFNAAINGATYWTRFGAEDVKTDRYPRQFGPVEVSYREATDYKTDLPPAPVKNPKNGIQRMPDTSPGEPARMDLTPLLTDPAYGNTLAARLRQFTDCGVLVRKEEVYDARYHTGTYEWSTATGRRGLLIHTPKLVVTLVADPHAEKIGKIAPPADITALARKPKGTPTAVMPTDTEIAGYIQRFGFHQPAGMPDWQWQRLQELKALRGEETASTLAKVPMAQRLEELKDHNGGSGFPISADGYVKWIDGLLATAPRQWLGHSTPRMAIDAMRFHDALPEAVREHLRNYFDAWVMPDRPTEQLDHPQAIPLWYGGKNKYWDETHDWRGNQSYYRAGYTRRMSTQNINHLGAAGALFGGALVGSKYAMADGRYGLEQFPLRLWAWNDGTTQESIDHYYLQLTLWTQKEFADFGPTQLDRMMGRSMLAKTMEEVVSSYHPGLRRFIAPSGRTDMKAVLLTQTGLRCLMHSLSHSGALTDLDDKNTFGIASVLDAHDMPPGYIADEWLIGPWAPAWMANMVDDKPLPYTLTAACKVWGKFDTFPGWKCSYLGQHYGLTSRDYDVEDAYHLVQGMAQWRRDAKPVERMDEVTTMMVRPEGDQRDMAWYGSRQWSETPPLGGLNFNVQYKNTLIALTSPVDMSKPSPEGRKYVPPRSLQATLGFYNFQQTPTWEIFIDGQRVTTLPARATAKQRITIHDGVTYVGITPIPATDLGRDAEIEISRDGIESIPTALYIRNYMLKRDTPLDPAKTDWARIDRAYAGFVIEMGDSTEYPNFAAFQQHIATSSLETRFEAGANVAHLKYTGGQNVLEAGICTTYNGGPLTQLFPYRRANGAWPYLPAGTDRDSTLAQQGHAGRLEKAGAVLRCEPGRMAYLQTEPRSGTFVGFNPLPDPTHWTLSLPGGVRVEADGLLGMTRVEVQPTSNRLTVDYAVKEEQMSADMATALLVFGLRGTPALTLNGKPFTDRLSTVKIGGEEAVLIPLLTPRVNAREVSARYQKLLPLRERAFASTIPATATLRNEPGQEAALASVPRSGVWRLQRLWPSPSVIEANTPDGLRLATDGRVALLRMDISRTERRIDLDLPPCEQDLIKEMKANALLVFGATDAPTLVVNGKPYTGAVGKADIDGQSALVYPLFGEKLDSVLTQLAARYREARKNLGK